MDLVIFQTTLVYVCVKHSNEHASINVVCMWGTRRDVHTRGYIFTVDTQCVTNLFTHSNGRLPSHRETIRIDTILLMWAVAENVKFRVCSSSRFSNGAHARRRCFYRKFDSAFRWNQSFRASFSRVLFRSALFFSFSSFFRRIAAADLRVETREKRDLFTNNFACHVSLNRHHV